MANFKKDCILIADDAAIDRRIVRLLLRKDYDLEEAGDGFEAVKHLEEKPDGYSALLLDMLMPGMDGFQVMAWMREHNLLDKIPVIALTAISDAQGHIRCYESGALDIIEKPFDEKLLIYKLKFDIERFRRFTIDAAAAASVGGAPAAAPVARSKTLVDDVKEFAQTKFGLTDPAEIADFVDTFKQSFGECADDLKAMDSANPDPMIIRQVTHKIYGFASAVGATRLNDFTLLLNAAAKQGEPQAMQAGVRLVLELYAECVSAAS